jgi:hypothetical protein
MKCALTEQKSDTDVLCLFKTLYLQSVSNFVPLIVFCCRKWVKFEKFCMGSQII